MRRNSTLFHNVTRASVHIECADKTLINAPNKPALLSLQCLAYNEPPHPACQLTK
uniref:Uncharacterized protein n=1 Tax=Anguilla anguilla TaxID=7936 RepID=A0A0E9SKW1_ANGAN